MVLSLLELLILLTLRALLEVALSRLLGKLRPPLLRLVHVALMNPLLTLGEYELPRIWRDITVDNIPVE